MRAWMRLELTDRDGVVRTVREAHNAVMRDGALLVAQLFSGAANTAPITHIGVGTSDAPEAGTFTTTSLANDPPLTGDTVAPIAAESFTVSTDPERRVAVVRVRATLPNTAAQGTICEAGLVSSSGATSVLYNRVTFAPLDKAGDHELTLFWEVTFPYGDLA
jgi:hypothetical protein